MQQEEQLSGEESLNLINRMIQEAKGYSYETGLAAIIYGFTAIVCSGLSFLREKEIIQFPFHPFYLMVPVFFIQSWVQYREEKKKLAKTFTDEAIDYIWIGFFLCVLAALCAGFAGIHYIQISFIIIVAALAAFLTGMVSKMRYMIVSGFICWALGIISFFVLNPYIYLLLTAVAIVIYVVPGFLLNAYFKKQQHGR